MAVTFKKCKLFDKTFSKTTQQIKSKFKDFVEWKSAHPTDSFGSSDYPFSGAGFLRGLWHAKLSFDISIIYRQEKEVIYLYGVFSHDESGTGSPSSKVKQSALATKLSNQEFV